MSASKHLPPPPVRRAFRRRSGFTLIETSVGAAIFALSAAGIFGLAILLRRVSADALYSATALNTAQSVMEQVISLPIAAPAVITGADNYLDNSSNEVQVVIVPPNAGLTRVTVPLNRPPWNNSPEVWNWTRVVVPAIASPPAVGGAAPAQPRDITVLLCICIQAVDAASPTREIHVYYTYEKPAPVRAIGPVKSLRVVRI